MPWYMYAAVAILMASGIWSTINSKKSSKEKRAKAKKLYSKLYRLISRFFMTAGKMGKVYKQVAYLSIYEPVDIQEISVKYFLIASGVSLGIVVAGVLLFKDIISTLICIAFALMANNVMIDKQVDSQTAKVYKAFKIVVSSVRQEYLRTGSIPESLEECEKPQIMIRPIEQIHSILTNCDAELALQRFYASTPFHSLQTFAAVCYNVNNRGDELNTKGQSNFLEALSLMISDINAELQRIQVMKAKFAAIEYLPLVPLFGMPLLESFFSGVIPGTTNVYNGVIGYVGRCLTLIASITSYTIISGMNRTSSVKTDDRNMIIVAMLKRRSFSRIIGNIVPKNRKAIKLTKRLSEALSVKNHAQFYAEKVLYSTVALLLSFIVILSAVTLSKDFMLNNTAQGGLVSSNDLEKYTEEQILALDNLYLERDHEWSTEEFLENIRASLPGMSEMQLYDQIKRLQNKDTTIKNAYMHWYYVVICLVLSAGAWFIPDALILVRRSVVRTEAEEDFLQLQTLMAILINTGIDTLDALGQMANHSKVHKDIVTYCYHCYPSNPELELTRFQSKTPIIEFKRFIGKMKLTISDLSLKEAYDDLLVEREHMAKMREMNMYRTMDKKRSLCGKLSMIPVGCLVVFGLLIPLVYLGMTEFMDGLSSLKM